LKSHTIILLLIFLFVCTLVQAQDDPELKKPPAPKLFLTTIPVRLALRDINVGFAHKIGGDRTVEYRLGWVHPNKLLHRYYAFWLTSTEMRYQGPSFYLQMNNWKANKKKKRIFQGVIVGYRYLWFTDQRMAIHDGDGFSDDEELTLSQWRSDILVLGTFGIGTTKFSMTEFSFGFRFMSTHSNVSDTKFYSPSWSEEEYANYIAQKVDEIPNDEGFTVAPIFRITSRIGWVIW
jgi:hypothetical protein